MKNLNYHYNHTNFTVPRSAELAWSARPEPIQKQSREGEDEQREMRMRAWDVSKGGTQIERAEGKGVARARKLGVWDGQAPTFLGKTSWSSPPKHRTRVRNPSSHTGSREITAIELILYVDCLPGVSLSTAVILKSLHFREHSSPTSSPVPNIRHCTHALLASQVPIQLWNTNQEIRTVMRARVYCDLPQHCASLFKFPEASDLNLHHLLFAREFSALSFQVLQPLDFVKVLSFSILNINLIIRDHFLSYL